MNNTSSKGRIDWLLTLTPFILIMALAALLFIFPDGSNNIISKVRFFFGDTLGIYYLIIGAGVLIVSLFLALSKYGDIVLGDPDEKPKYSFFTWGCMMFTCGLAADILFYSIKQSKHSYLEKSISSQLFAVYIMPDTIVKNTEIQHITTEIITIALKYSAKAGIFSLTAYAIIPTMIPAS